jgi:uncharacterized coiled-coil protein SlyX
LTLLLLPALVGCQPANNSAAIDDVNKNLNKVLGKIQDLEEAAKGWPVVKKDVDDLGRKVAAVEKGLQANVEATYNQSVVGGQLAKKVEQEIPEQLAQLKATLAATNERLAKAETSAALAANFDKRIDKLERDVKANEAGLLANVEATYNQGVTLGQIAAKDSTGRWIPARLDLLTKQSAEFKEQFGKAVSEVTPPAAPQPVQPTWGTVRIDNRMLTSQYIEINGFGRWVSPLSYVDVTVPAGWATVRLVEYEVAKNWWVGAPSYFQTVIIDRQPSYATVIW